MPRFFIQSPVEDFFEITGEDATHIKKSLRMKCGEKVVLCHEGVDYNCEIVEFCGDLVRVKLLDFGKCTAEPSVKVTLFQGLPKGDKMDLIVQKAVEVGVCEVVPVLTSRCVSRPEEKSLQKKVQRWQKIAREAAKQSGRGCIPKISEAVDLKNAIKLAKKSEKTVLFYENGGEKLSEILNRQVDSIAIFVGPEGGFEDSEVELMESAGAEICSLGQRILRTETAAIVTVVLALYESER